MENPNLTSSDPYKRAQAVDALVEAMDNLNPERCRIFADFLIARLSDQLSVPACINGLLKILKSGNFMDYDKVWIAILEELNVSSFPQNVRFMILEIYSQTTQNSSNLTKEFVQGCIHIFQGEKDPRCLLIALQLMKKIIDNFDCKGLEEEIFDWVFAYFPITFQSKDDDPISQDDLKNALLNCMSGNLIGMGEFVIPFLMEKMESTLGLTKRDTMLFLAHASKVYNHKLFYAILPKLWLWLKEEIMKPENEENCSMALYSIKEILRSLSCVNVFSKDQNKNNWEGIVYKIMAQVMDDLKSDHIRINLTERIFFNLATTSSKPLKLISENVFENLVSKFGDDLLTMYNDETATPRKLVLSIFLYNLVKAARIIYGDQPVVSKDFERLKEDLLNIFTIGTAFSTDYCDLRFYSLAGLSEMMLCSQFLSEDQIRVTILQVKKTLLEDSIQKNRDLALETLRAMGFHSPIIVRELCCQDLMNMIRSGTSISDSMIYRSFAGISMEDSLFDFALTNLTQSIIEAIEGNSNLSLENLLSLSLLLIENRVEFDSKHAKVESRFMYSCSEILFRPLMNAGLKKYKTFKGNEMHILEKIAFKIMRLIDLESQINITRSIIDKITPDIINSNMILPITAIIGNSRPGISDKIDMVPLLYLLVEFRPESHIDKSHIWKCISSIINKVPIDILRKILHDIKLKICDKDLSISLRKDGVLLYSWIIKAIVSKSKRNKEYGLDMVMDLLILHEDSDLCHFAPEAIDILISDDINGYITKKSFCDASILYKQRLFNYCLPILSDGFLKSAEKAGTSSIYLLTMSHMLKNIPKSVLLGEAPKLMPFIIQSLDSSDSSLAIEAMDLLCHLIEDSPKLIAEHISSIIPILLRKVVFNDGENPLRLRMSACLSIATIPKFLEYAVIHPFKRSVLQNLSIACDDHKRIVRSNAAKAKNMWHLL